jgi:hypothetical protein
MSTLAQRQSERKTRRFQRFGMVALRKAAHPDCSEIFEQIGKKFKAPTADPGVEPFDWGENVVPLHQWWPHKIQWTRFPSQSAQSLTLREMTLEQLGELIRSTSARTKTTLPWLKLAVFGEQRSDKGSLRHDGNVVDVTGAELDYDGEKVSLDEAAAIVRKARLCALLYTTPSHTEGKPRWRLVLPASRGLPPADRARLAARANGLFGGVFSRESFTLSQSYYFGAIKGNPAPVVIVTKGRCINHAGDLDAGAIGRKDGKSFEAAPSAPRERVTNNKAGNGKAEPDDPFSNLDIEKIKLALAAIPNTAEIDRSQWFDIGQSVHDGTAGSAKGLAAWIAWTKTWKGLSKEAFEECEAYCTKTWESMNPREITVASLYGLADKATPGWRHPGETDKQETVTPLKTRLMQTSAQFVAGFKPPDYLIDGLLQRRYVYSLTGPTGSGKTAIALLFALHVALGRELGDMEVEKGRVLVFAGENPDDVRSRWIKVCEVFGEDPDMLDVVFMPFTLPISEAKIRKQIDAEAAEHGPFSLLIVDTSAAYYSGSDENDNVALGNHARMLRSFVDLPGGPTVLVTCHPTKAPDMGNLLPRGGGAFLAEVDGNLVCIKEKGSMVAEISTHGKFRGPEFAPFSFKLVSATSDKLKDTKGRSIWTVYAAPISNEEQENIERQGRSQQNDLLSAMLNDPGRSLIELAEYLLWNTQKGQPNKLKAQRMMEKLAKDKLVEKRRDGHYVLTKKGEEEAKNVPGAVTAAKKVKE